MASKYVFNITSGVYIIRMLAAELLMICSRVRYGETKK